MKKFFLFLAGCAIVLNAIAQDRKIDAAALRNYNQQKNAAAHKSTTGGARRYNYGYAMDTSQNYYNNITLGNGPAGNGTFTGLAATTIWNDTNGTELTTAGVYRHVTTICEAAVFDPAAAILNVDLDQAYIGQIRVRGGITGDAYNIDSVTLFGVYYFNKLKTSVVDTLRCVFVTGNGSASSDIFSGLSVGSGHYSGNAFLDMIWDSVTNTVSSRTYITTYKKDIILNSATWADTNKNGVWSMTVHVNGTTGISVAAGSFCGMSITFISGDPATKTGILSTPTPGDTLIGTWLGSGNNKYNVWRPLVAYYANADTATWAPYQCPTWEPYTADQNLGYWKKLPNTPANWDSVFSPTWAQSNGSSPSALQYPYINWYVTCPTCSVPFCLPDNADNVSIAKNIINAIPNPATDELNIEFNLTQESDVSVTLTNMIGQVVAIQKLNNTNKGKAVFNTLNFPDGIYLYTLSSNGEQTTGRVVIAH